MKDIDWKPYDCPKEATKRDPVRWDICISRQHEAKIRGKKHKCNHCDVPGKVVKMLVMEVL